MGLTGQFEKHTLSVKLYSIKAEKILKAIIYRLRKKVRDYVFIGFRKCRAYVHRENNGEIYLSIENGYLFGGVIYEPKTRTQHFVEKDDTTFEKHALGAYRHKIEKWPLEKLKSVEIEDGIPMLDALCLIDLIQGNDVSGYDKELIKSLVGAPCNPIAAERISTLINEINGLEVKFMNDYLSLKQEQQREEYDLKVKYERLIKHLKESHEGEKAGLMKTLEIAQSEYLK